MIAVTQVTLASDLAGLAADINGASWDEANDISPYSGDALRAYLECEDTLFHACYEEIDGKRVLLGMASSRILIKPYDEERWLYVDEVDVCADQRQKGAGKAMMQALIAYAEVNGLMEVWLGTEVDNVPANALYRSIEPDDVDTFVGYTWETDA